MNTSGYKQIVWFIFHTSVIHVKAAVSSYIKLLASELLFK